MAQRLSQSSPRRADTPPTHSHPAPPPSVPTSGQDGNLGEASAKAPGIQVKPASPPTRATGSAAQPPLLSPAERLWQAAKAENAIELQNLLRQGLDINARLESGQTLFHHAVAQDLHSVAALLFKHGAVVDLFDSNWETPLMCAARNGSHLLVEALLAWGAEPGMRDTKDQHPLDFAIKAQCLTSVTLLCPHKKRLYLGNPYCPLVAAIQTGNLPIVRTLIRQIERNGETIDFKHMFHCAVGAGHAEVATFLFNRGELKLSDPELEPWHEAAREGRAAMLDTLLALGFKLPASGNKENLLQLAYEGGHAQTMVKLKAMGVSIQADTLRLERPVASGNIAMVRLLIEWGAGDWTQSPDRMLRKAIWWGHTEIAQLLKENGARPDPDKFHKQLCMAASEGNSAMVQWLVDQGAELNDMRNGIYTPLAWAAKKGHLETVQTLLKLGADGKIFFHAKQSPIALAASEGKEDVVRELIRHSDAQSIAYAFRNALAEYPRIVVLLWQQGNLDPEVAIQIAEDESASPACLDMIRYTGKPTASDNSSSSHALPLTPPPHDWLTIDFFNRLASLSPSEMDEGPWQKAMQLGRVTWKLLKKVKEDFDRIDRTQLCVFEHYGDITHLVLFASFLSLAPCPDFATQYAALGLDEITLARMVNAAERDFNALQQIATSIIETHCTSQLEELSRHCIGQTSANLSAATHIVSWWNRVAGIVPPAGMRIEECWVRTLDQARQNMWVKTSLANLVEYLEARLGTLFAQNFNSVQFVSGFYQTSEAGPALHILGLHLNYIQQHVEHLLEAPPTLDTAVPAPLTSPVPPSPAALPAPLQPSPAQAISLPQLARPQPDSPAKPKTPPPSPPIEATLADLDLLEKVMQMRASATAVQMAKQFVHAAGLGAAKTVAWLLQEGGDPNCAWGPTTPLMAAAAGKHVHVVKLLLEAGANASHHPETAEPAIVGAALAGSADVVELLLPYADLDSIEKALLPALAGGHADVAELLLPRSRNTAAALAVALKSAHAETLVDLVLTLQDEDPFAESALSSGNSSSSAATRSASADWLTAEWFETLVRTSIGGDLKESESWKLALQLGVSTREALRKALDSHSVFLYASTPLFYSDSARMALVPAAALLTAIDNTDFASAYAGVGLSEHTVQAMISRAQRAQRALHDLATTTLHQYCGSKIEKLAQHSLEFTPLDFSKDGDIANYWYADMALVSPLALHIGRCWSVAREKALSELQLDLPFWQIPQYLASEMQIYFSREWVATPMPEEPDLPADPAWHTVLRIQKGLVDNYCQQALKSTLPDPGKRA